jgi:pimeloyl-ACP methyl ester carboxylesterase
MWMGDVAAWAEHFRVYAVDLIGEPGLSAPSRPPLASEAYALWLDDVLHELELTRVSIIGASLGGWLALDYAIRRPGRVERLVLLCPSGIGRQKVGWLVKAVLLRPFGRWGLRRTMESVAGLRLPRTRAFVDSMVLAFTQFRPRKERIPVASDDALHRLEMPVLVIVGEHDAMLDSRDTRRRVERHLPRATVIFLPGVGHSIVGQTGPILDFLRDRAAS